MSMNRKYIFAAAIVAATVVFLIKTSVEPLSSHGHVLGSGGYNIVSLAAPIATGSILEIIAAVLSNVYIGPPLRRMLLNDNNIVKLRELASQLPLEPLHFPMDRVNSVQWNEAAKLSASFETSFQKNFLLNGLPNHANHDSRWRSVQDYNDAYRSGKTTPSAVMKGTLLAIQSWEKDHDFKVFSHIIPEEVLRQAAESDARWAASAPLSVFDGVPVAFKDMMDIIGHTVREGKSVLPEHGHLWKNATKDDTVVRRFREAGAIIVGLTIMTEGGCSPMGWNAHFQGPTSPFHRSRYSGGSSSGSAVAVATGLVPVSIGFDGGGSIRIPAAMSGVHGLATTFGRIPFDDHTFVTNIKAGPFGTCTNDVALAYGLMSDSLPGHFYTTSYGPGGPPHTYLHASQTQDSTSKSDLAGVRIGLFKDWVRDGDAEVVAEFDKVVAFLTDKGATVVEIAIPHMQQLSFSHGMKIASEFAVEWDFAYSTSPDAIEAETKVVLGLGNTVTALEILAAEKLRAWAYNYVKALYADHNLTVILTPTVSVLPPVLGDAAKVGGESNTAQVVKMMKHIFIANFLGLPGYSIPISGLATSTNGDAHRLPVALQLLGDHWQEDKLFTLSNYIEYHYANPLLASNAEEGGMKRANPMHLHRPF